MGKSSCTTLPDVMRMVDKIYVYMGEQQHLFQLVTI